MTASQTTTSTSGLQKACDHGGKLILGLLLLVVSGIFTPAEAQFGNGYSYRREVNLVDAQVAGGPHTNFPVLISSTLADLRTTANSGKVEDANGYDIIFTSDQAGTTPLAHEIERYVATTGEIVFWVRVESLISTTSIYLFYGNSGIATFQGDVTSSGVTGVWDNDYLGVWHLDETVVDNATGATHFDSTPNNHHGIQTRNGTATGQIGIAQDFDGNNDYIEDADGELYINGLTAYTLSLWIESDVTGVDRGFINGDPPDGQDEPFGIRYDRNGAIGGGNDVIKTGVTVSGLTQEYESSSNVQTTNWQYLSTTWSSGNQHAVFIDGTLDTSTAGEPPRTGSLVNSTTFRIGQAQRAGQADWDGRIDEVRLSSTLRGAQWIATEYNNQLSPAAFYVLGAEEAPPVAIVKRAFLPDGTPIPTGTSIPSGVEFKFLLYVNNASAALSDISVRDALDAAFLYQPGTIQVDNSVAECAATPCTASEELAIFTAVDAAPFLSDAPGDDVVSYAAPFVDAGDGNVGNLQLDINADAVWAMLFSAKMP